MPENVEKLDAKATMKALKSLGIPRLYTKHLGELELTKADAEKFLNIMQDVNTLVNEGSSVVFVYADVTKSGCLATKILYKIVQETWSELYYVTPDLLAATKVDNWGEGGLWETYCKANVVFVDGVSSRMNALENTSLNGLLETRLYNSLTTLLVIERDAIGLLSDRVTSALKPKYGVLQFGFEKKPR